MIRHKSLPDFLHDKIRVVHFDIGTVRKDKPEPKPDVVILDPVQPHLAFFGLAFRYGNLAFQNIQIDQNPKVLWQIRLRATHPAAEILSEEGRGMHFSPLKCYWYGWCCVVGIRINNERSIRW